MRRGRTRRILINQSSEPKIDDDKGLHDGPTPPHDPLGKAQSQRIIEAAFKTMREAGVEFEPDPQVLKLFRDAGCDVSESGLVKFPTELVCDALASMAKSVKLWNRPGTEFIEIDNRHTWFIPGMTCIKVFDEETGEPRDSNRDDLALITRVADALQNIDAVTITCKIVDRSDIFGEIDEFAVLAQNTTKPLEYLCEHPESLDVVIDMAAAIRGGHQQLSDKPYFMQLVTPLPLYYAKVHTDQIINGVRAGIPMATGTIVIGGASAPITMAGCLVHSLATDFAGMVLGQLVRKGAFCIGGSDASFMEAATGGIGAFTQSSLADKALCQIARELDYPSLTGIGGDSRARRFNQDAVWEISTNMMQTFYSRPATCDYVGELDQGITYSLHSMLFCDELAGMLRKMWKGIDVTDETLAMDLTLQEGPRGNYLANRHTADHCRTESWNSRYFGPNMPVTISGKPDIDLFGRIDEELITIIRNHRPEPLAQDVLDKMNSIQKNFEATHISAASGR
jgi:trimethylamine--corrinoid protein Co-methyltransferase